jgi:hypothetical protein
MPRTFGFAAFLCVRFKSAAVCGVAWCGRFVWQIGANNGFAH